jgi:NADPH-dependent 2,4-dienoyl-CoA reductase/sulfur reductase-like enzyme
MYFYFRSKNFSDGNGKVNVLIRFQEKSLAMSGEPKSVLIIGAGIAGLTAAAKLAKCPEFSVTVLEGADRIGGRVHSKEFGK